MQLVIFIRGQYTNLVALLRNKATKVYVISLFSLWEILNLCLLIISKGYIEVVDKILYIYPFRLNHQTSCLWAYDVSEFILYAIALPFVAMVFYVYVSMSFVGKAKKKILLYFNLFLLYCLGFTLVSLFNNLEIIEFYFACFKAVSNFIIAYEIGGYILRPLIMNNRTLLLLSLCFFVQLGLNSCKSSTDNDELSVELSDSYAEVTKWCSCFFGIKNGSGNYDIIVSDNQGVEASFDKVNNMLVVKGLKEGYYDVGLFDKATRKQVSARVWVLPQALILISNRGRSTTDSFFSSHYDLFLTCWRN